MDTRDKYAVIVAAGNGIRMGNPIPKQYLPILGKPVLYYSIRTFLSAFPDIRIILVHAKDDHLHIEKVLTLFPENHFILITGGKTRFHSVKNGLELIKTSSVVFIHDGVRPMTTPALIHSLYEAAIGKGNAVPCLPLKESIRQIRDGKSHAVDRNEFRSVQTPQAFLSEIILPAFRQPYDPAFTDEAGVAEKSGVPINLITGEEKNIKITRPQDLLIAEQFLKEYPY